ncbi:MAG: helix-turn-helix domain-containing protein [Pseudomonadota bacterium]
MAPALVAVVAFDNISPFHLSVPCVVFSEGRPGEPTFRLVVCSAEDGPLRTSAGFDITTSHRLSVLAEADIVIVPSWRDPAERPPQALLDALVAAHQRGAWVVGLCIGAYVLAEAGLLNHRQATTHWAFAQDFAERFPLVRLDPDVLYIEDGQLLTSAGTAAGIDCCLHLLRQGHGREAANKVARRLVVPPHRQGGQKQFIEQAVPKTTRDARLGGLLDMVRASLNQPHRLETLAEQASMSRRTFTRQFRQLTGLPFGDWIQAERLALAQQLLESSQQPVEGIAFSAGFGTAASLRLHFQRAFGVSPSAWRLMFRGEKVE